MVETVNAQTLLQSAGGSSSPSGLEPGTEIKAKVESNLSGGVVRLATESGKMDLRVPNPLPVGADVSVTVGGTKQHPVVQITTNTTSGQTGQPVPAPGTKSAEPPVAQGQYGLLGSTQFGGSARTIKPFTTLAHLLQPGGSSPQAPQGDGNAPTQQRPPGVTTSTVGNLANQSGGVQSGGGSVTNPSSGGHGSQPSLPSTPAGTQSPGVARAVPTGQATGLPPSATGASPPASSAGAGATIAPQATPATGSADAGPPLPSSSGRAQIVAPQPSGAGTVSNAAPQPAGPAVGSSSVSSSPQPTSAGNSAGSPAQTASNPQTSNPVPAPSPGAGAPSGALQSASAQQTFSGPVQTTTVSAAQGNQAMPASVLPSQNPPGLPPSPTPQSATGAQPQPATGAQLTGNNPSSATVSAGAGQSAPQAGITPPSTQSAIPPQANTAAQPQVTTTQQQANAPQPQTTISQSTVRADVATQPNLPTGQASRSIPAQPYPASRDTAPSGANRLSSTGNSTSATQTGVQQAASVLTNALGEQQTGLGGLFAQVGTLAAAQSSGKVSLPDPVVKAMQQILGLRLNSSQMPTGRDIQQSVQLSGQFREAGLTLPQSGTQPLPDLKSVLLSFKSLLQQLGAEPQISRPAGQPPTPTLQGGPQGQPQQSAAGLLSAFVQQNLQSLLKDTDQALARIRLTQLVNAGVAVDEGPHVASRPMDLVVELPLSLGQETAVMQMQIGRDGSGAEDEAEDEQAWRLRFSLDLTATGPLEAAISLRGGGTYASLWVDRKETFDQLEAVRETMEASFADAGLDLQELRLIRGLPPKTAAKYGTLVNRQS